MTQQYRGDFIQMSSRVEEWCPPYIALAAAKLGRTKGQIITEALRQHREYLVRCGVLRKDEA